MQSKLIQLLGVQAGTGGRVPGAQDGPWVLREAGLIARLEALGYRIEDLGDIPGIYETRYTIGPPASLNNLATILQVNRHIHACVLGTIRNHPDGLLLVVGGDHSLAIGTLAGLSDSSDRLGLIWIDAHADFNTPATSPSGNVHGMSLAVACGEGHRDLRHIADRDPMVAEEDVHLIGVRDVDAAERRNLSASRVQVVTAKELQAGRPLSDVVAVACDDLITRCDRIHLSFDIDVIDPKFAPGTGTPAAGGITPEEALEALRTLGSCGRIGSAEFVEYNPELDADGRTGELALSLIEAFFS